MSVWQPSQACIDAAQVSALMRRLGHGAFEALRAASVSDPAGYWREVLDFCQIVWRRQPEGYLDASAGAAFPRWFPGGRLNWVESVTRWAGGPGVAHDAIVAESEEGEVVRLPWSALEARVRALAEGLARIGVRRGDRVAMLMENGLEASLGFLAVPWLGAVLVPLFSGFGAEAIASRLRDCGARVLLASSGYRRRGGWLDLEPAVREARAAAPALQTVVWKRPQGARGALAAGEADWHTLACSDGRARDAAEMDPNDPFLVIYTSGTTGRPKGAVHVHGGFPIKLAHDSAVFFDVRPGEVFSWPADMGWVAGAIMLSSALLRGATLVCYTGAPEYPDWSRMARFIASHRVTHYGAAPTLIRALAAHADQALGADLSSVRVLATGGEVCAPEHFSWFHKHFGGERCPVINFSGGTEAGGALLCSVPVLPISAGGFNTRSPAVDVDVIDAMGHSLVDQPGELAIRAPFVGMTRSFWNDDERYLDTYWRTVPGLWVHGDLVLRRPDGACVVLGRSDDTLKLAGKRTGPAEIEEVVLELSEIAEAAAVGLDDSAKGQILVVFVVLRPGGAAAADAIGLRTRRHVGERIGRAFAPARVHVVSQLPKTRSGKIMRRLIRATCAGLPPGDLSALDNPSALDELRAFAPGPDQPANR